MKTLTRPEKDAIRAQPCGKCGAVPPFPDGSRCHPHRLIPENGYVADNVVPRCPECHAAEPGHHVLTKFAVKGGQARQTKMTPGERAAHAHMVGQRVRELHPGQFREMGLRSQELHPDLARERGLKVMRALHAKLTPAERSANSSKAGRAAVAKLRARLTPAELSAKMRALRALQLQ